MSNPRPLNEAREPGLEAPEREGWDTSWGRTRDDGRVGERVGIADLLTRTTFLKKRVLDHRTVKGLSDLLPDAPSTDRERVVHGCQKLAD